MIPAMFWTNSGPGVREVPDSFPIVVEIPTIYERKSLRGETFSKVEMRTFYRQLYAAPLTKMENGEEVPEDNFSQWKDFPGAKIALRPDPIISTNPETGEETTTGVKQTPILLMIIYTEWEPA